MTKRTPFWLSLILLALTSPAIAGDVVYFIGDGLGPAQVTAARIYKTGADGEGLHVDGMEQVGLVRTWAANNIVTDSAAAGTALASGVKTNIFSIGVGPDGKHVESMLVKAKRKGMSTGIISTARITHATPAAFYAHTRNRWGEADIAAQLIESDDWDLAMGGGREFFMTNLQADGETDEKGRRGDGRDLLKEAGDKGIRVIQTREQFDALARDAAEGENEIGRVLGIFDSDHMTWEIERDKDVWGEPSLREMTEVAIDILDDNPNGYFLVVEGGRIDHAAHGGYGKLMLSEVIAFDDAVAAALATEPPEGDKPLVVVTSDHETGGLAINGYESLDIQGDALFTSTKPVSDEILTFSTGPGAKRPAGNPDRTDPRYRQAAVAYADSASHTGVDVPLYAHGPGSAAFSGTMDNTDVAKKIMTVLGVK